MELDNSNFNEASIEIINTIINLFESKYDKNLDFDTALFQSVFDILYAIFKVAQNLKNNELKKFVCSKLYFINKMLIENKAEYLSKNISAITSIIYLIYNDNFCVDFKKECESLSKRLVLLIKTDTFLNSNLSVNCQLIKLFKITQDEEILKNIQNFLVNQRSELFYKVNNIQEGSKKYVFNMISDRLTLLKFGYEDLNSKNDLKVLTKLLEKFNFENINLYNGFLGQLVLLNECANLLDDKTLKRNCLKKIDLIINEFISKKEIVKKQRVENIGLFNGISGVCYTLLKVCNKDIPNILIYEC